MALADYYELFYLQEWQPRPDGFGGTEYGWGDGAEIMGMYAQDSSTEMRVAEAQGIASKGVFVADMGVDVAENVVLRRAKDSLYIKITGLPVDAPTPTISKFRKMNAEKTVKP